MVDQPSQSGAILGEPPVPVTLLTGFLGAGKTTLLNAILSDDSTDRIAVIVNEFGEVGLDHDLIEAVEDEVVLMQSGCLCCSIRGDLSETIANLLQSRRDGDLQFNRVVIETTGIAEPGPILKTLTVDPLLAKHTQLDGVVTLVDAVNGADTLNEQFEAVSQVVLAEIIVVSKTDLAEGTDVEALEKRIRGLNAEAEILRSVKGAVSPQMLWGVGALRPDFAAEPTAVDLPGFASIAPQADPLANLSGIAPKADGKSATGPHDKRITSASIVLDAPLKPEVFDAWLGSLVAQKGPNLLRVKGVVFLRGIEIPFAFHGVQHVFEPPVPLQSWRGEDRRSRIVIIARDLDRAELQDSINALRPVWRGKQA